MNGAAETADGQPVLESSIEFEMVQRSVQGVGTFIVVSKRVLEDSVMLASYVDTRLRYVVELRIDNQLVADSGIGQNISAMTKAGNFVAFTAVAAETMLDSISRAIGEVAVVDNRHPAEPGRRERHRASERWPRPLLGRQPVWLHPGG